MIPIDNPVADSVQEKQSECQTLAASADPSAGSVKTTRRDFLKSGGMLSVSSLLGAGALMTQSDNAQGATEWAEHFQGNYRLMTPQEKAEARARLERRYSSEYGKKVTVDGTEAQPGVLMGYALNVRKCIGCRRCVKACVEENTVDRGINESPRPASSIARTGQHFDGYLGRISRRCCGQPCQRQCFRCCKNPRHDPITSGLPPVRTKSAASG